jgi:hypothetical protein
MRRREAHNLSKECLDRMVSKGDRDAIVDLRRRRRE